MKTPAASGRDWEKFIFRGFSTTRSGTPRKVEWLLFAILGLALPALSLVAIYRIFSDGLYRAFVTGHGLGIWILTVAMYSFTLLGVTVGYHRLFTHRGFTAVWPVRLVLLIAAGMSWEGDAKTWIKRHRLHHANADIIGVDVHTPWEYAGWRGLLWAQWFWLFFHYEMPSNFKPRDLEEDRLIQWQSGRYGFPILAVISLIIPLAIYGWDGLLVAGFLRLTVMLTVTGFINSWTHLRGTKPRDSLGQEYLSDDSVDSIPVALLSFGEGNHARHHGDPKSARHGWTATLRPEAIAAGAKPDRHFRPDLSWRVIQLLAYLHLVSDVYVAPADVVFNDKQVAPKKALREIHELDQFSSRAGHRMADRDRAREASKHISA